jgi:hypothetical protein
MTPKEQHQAEKLALAVINACASYAERVAKARTQYDVRTLAVHFKPLINAEARQSHYDGERFSSEVRYQAAKIVADYMLQHVKEF